MDRTKSNTAARVATNGLASALAAAAAACGLAGCGGGVPSSFGGVGERDLMFVSAAQTWDLDKNNEVTCEEWTKYTSDLFQSADKNVDGNLSKEEYQNVMKSDRLFETAGFSFFDSNSDGNLTLAEFTGRENPAFRILDRDKDCRISANETVQTRQMETLSQGGGGAPGSIPGSGPGGVGR